jgi:hypothetical protein
MSATGAFAISIGDGAVNNSGSIDADVYGVSLSGELTSYGALVVTFDGAASVANSGTVNSYAGGYGYGGINAYGVLAASIGGDATIDNSGTINATAYGYGYFDGVDAIGAAAYSIDGSATVTNSGDINATATNDPASTPSTAPAPSRLRVLDLLRRHGRQLGHDPRDRQYLLREHHGGQATGIYAGSYDGDVTVINSGDVSAVVSGGYVGFFLGSAVGINAYAYNGGVSVDNSGSVSATVDYGVATGIRTYSGYYDNNVSNSGSVYAASTVLGYYTYGVRATSSPVT